MPCPSCLQDKEFQISNLNPPAGGRINLKSQTVNFQIIFECFVICFLELICYLGFVALEFLALWARWVSAKDCSATV